VNLLESLSNEFAHEAETTRKHLERLPADKFDWKPHQKSFSAIGLASHIVDSLSWTESIFNTSGLDFDPATYKPYQAASKDGLLSDLDEKVRIGKEALAKANESSVDEPWALKVKGKVWFEKPRAEVFRDMVLSHIIHHRGQFSVYLRLLEVPVPGSYGPSADEGFPAAG
jgi:uncharacterized damage-inducible protein DinB